ncbi:MAG: CHASE2 domain-containing protein [Microcoleus sp.]
MSKLVILEIRDADNEQRYPVTLRICDSINYQNFQSTVSGKFPPAKDLIESYDNLKRNRMDRGFGSYRKLEKLKKAQVTNVSVKELADAVEISVNNWLNFPDSDFQDVRDLLLKVLSAHKNDVRVIIETDNISLWSFPWHLWNKFQEFEIEPSFCLLTTNMNSDLGQINYKSKIKILVILGEDSDINLAVDLQLLEESIDHNNAEITTLTATNSSKLDDELWKQNWDILFFAGHSYSENDYSQGKLALSETESIAIKDLKYGLENAIKHGLKLAIFNSCDGMGLVKELASLEIPAIIAMRERVPDEVAQKFLEHFLNSFAREKKSLRDSVMQARKKLHVMDIEYPCASWLPMIYEHRAVEPPTWDELLKGNEEERQPVSIWRNLRTVLVASVLVTGTVMGVRWLGLLEPLELPAYDYLMRQRQPEPIDPRLLVVEITGSDLDKYGNPVKDATVAKLIEKIEQNEPRAIGLTLHRYQPQQPGREALIAQFKNSNLLGVCAFGDGNQQGYPPAPELSEKQIKDQIGFSDLEIDDRHDNNGRMVRRQLLSYNPQRFPSSCPSPFSLSLKLAYRFIYGENIQPITQENDKWKFGKIILQPLGSQTGGFQKLGESDQILLNYRANPMPAQKVTLTEVIEGRVSRNLIKDKIVLIGVNDPRGKEEVDTPYGRMATVWVHAHMVSQILSAVIDKPNRPLLWVLPQWSFIQWGDTVFIWVFAFSGGLLAWRFRSPLQLTLAAGVATCIIYYLCLAILHRGGWMPLVPSVLALFTTGGTLVLYTVSREQKHL